MLTAPIMEKSMKKNETPDTNGELFAGPAAERTSRPGRKPSSRKKSKGAGSTQPKSTPTSSSEASPKAKPAAAEKAAPDAEETARKATGNKSDGEKPGRRNTKKKTSIPDDINKKHDLLQLFTLDLNVAKMTLGPMLANLFRIRTMGRENVPESGGGLVICNHASYLDPMIMGLYFPRPATFLAMSDLFTIRDRVMELFNEIGTITGLPMVWHMAKPFMQFWSTLVGDGFKTQLLEFQAVPVVRNYRGSSAKEAMAYYNDLQNQMLNILNEEKVLAIFPEGGRTRTGELLEFKTMAAGLALEANKPIYPTALTGTYDSLNPANLISGNSFLRDITYSMGKPIMPDDFPKTGNKKQKACELTVMMRESVEKLMAEAAQPQE